MEAGFRRMEERQERTDQQMKRTDQQMKRTDERLMRSSPWSSAIFRTHTDRSQQSNRPRHSQDWLPEFLELSAGSLITHASSGSLLSSGSPLAGCYPTRNNRAYCPMIRTSAEVLRRH